MTIQKVIPIARCISGSPSGIVELAERTRVGNIPGYTIPPLLVEQTTSQPKSHWAKLEEANQYYEVPSTHLGGLANIVFGHEPTTEWLGSHLTTPHSPRYEFHVDGSRASELAIHIQGETTKVRKVILGDQNEEFDKPYMIDPRMSDEEIEKALKQCFPDREFWFGSTELGAATVFSNIHSRRTPHVFIGEGQWTRFNGPIDLAFSPRHL